MGAVFRGKGKGMAFHTWGLPMSFPILQSEFPAFSTSESDSAHANSRDQIAIHAVDGSMWYRFEVYEI